MKKLFVVIFLFFICLQLTIADGPKIQPGEVKIEFKTTTLRICPPSIFGSETCQYPDLTQIIITTTNFIANNIAPPTLVILIIIGGFVYMLSMFKSDFFIQLGHKYIQWAIYGYVILVIISGIFTLIGTIFGGR